MKYERFEDLPVWKAAMELGLRVYGLTRDRFFTQSGDLRDQMRRAVLSISNNIAEGFERGTTAELLYFLYIAHGSCGEVRSMLRFVERCGEAAALKGEVGELITGAESCTRQIRAWADSLQNCDIAGQKYLNEKTRNRYQAKMRADVFERQLQEMVRKNRPQEEP